MNFHVAKWSLIFDVLKILVKFAKSLKHHNSFGKFLETLLYKNVTYSHAYVC